MNHLGDALSAYVDGELSPAELAAADQHLAGCPACRHDLAATATTRELLRSAVRVEPPPGFFDRVDRLLASHPDRRRSPFALAGVAAAAAMWLLVLTAAPPSVVDSAEAVALPVHQLVASHSAAQRTVGIHPVSIGTADALGFRSVGLGDVPNRYPVPGSLGAGLSLVGVRRDADVVQLLYTNGVDRVSVFEQAGSVDWSSLPEGERSTIRHRRAWLGADATARLVVFERAGMVFLVVSDAPRETVLAAAEGLPSPEDRSLVDRVRRACRGLVSSFGLRG